MELTSGGSTLSDLQLIVKNMVRGCYVIFFNKNIMDSAAAATRTLTDSKNWIVGIDEWQRSNHMAQILVRVQFCTNIYSKI